MPIIVSLDVMLAKRKMRSKDLADRIGIADAELVPPQIRQSQCSL